MGLKSITEIYDMFYLTGFDKVLFQVKTNAKGNTSYCLRADHVKGYPIDIDSKMAVDFINAVKNQSYSFLKDMRLVNTGGSDPERVFYRLARREFGSAEAHHAITG